MKLAFRNCGAMALLCLPALGCLADGVRLKLDTSCCDGMAMPPQAAVSQLPDLMDVMGQAPAAAPREMTLAQAVRLAVGRHPAIQAATFSVEQQAGGVDSARAGYYPQISAGVNTGTATSRSGGQTGSHVASLTLSQMVYDFGKVSSRVEQAQANVRRQQALLPKQIDTVALQTGEAVVGLHRYQALSAIAEEQVGALGRVLELARLRADAGLSTQADPIQARSRLEAAQVLQQQYGAQLRQARERLRTLLGPEAPETVAAMAPELLEDAQVERPLQLNELPDVIAAEAELTAAVAALRNARAQGMPTISLEASVNQAISGTVSGTDGRHRYGTVGIGVSTPLYQGGAQEGAVRSATAAIDAARAQIEVARLNAADQIRALREQINGVQGRLAPLAQRSRTIAQTRELYQEQYKLGTRSVLDLLSAEQEIFQARTDQQTAEHDLWVGLVDFVVVSGAGRRIFGLDVPAQPAEAPSRLPPAAERRPEPQPDPAQVPTPVAMPVTPLPDTPAELWQRLLPLGFFR